MTTENPTAVTETQQETPPADPPAPTQEQVQQATQQATQEAVSEAQQQHRNGTITSEELRTMIDAIPEKVANAVKELIPKPQPTPRQKQQEQHQQQSQQQQQQQTVEEPPAKKSFADRWYGR